jgi:hypothetical protein
VEVLEERAVPTGTWTTLANVFPGGSAGLMLLLSDGTIMVQGGEVNASSAWYKLTPDSTGSYIRRTWSQLASMHTARIAFASNVLPDGRVLVVGGEYSGPNNAGNRTNTGESYDPIANTWMNIPNFPQPKFGDDPSEGLPNGEVLGGFIGGPQTYLYDPARDVWSSTGFKLGDDQSAEETWMKLPDGSILSYDIFASISDKRFEAQRYIPSTGRWVDASSRDANNPPSLLSTPDVGYELGPASLLPNGNAIFFGANGNTAIYSPSTDTWTAGPAEPTQTMNGRSTQLVMADAPGAMMPNGDILLALAPEGTIAGGQYTFPSPAWIYEFNPTTNMYTDVTPSDFKLNTPSEFTTMLVLPSGQVMLTNGTRQIAIFTPDGAPNPVWQPTIGNITNNGNNVFTLAGTQLNGVSEGANYGDDAEMASNYPIIRLTDANGNVSYARTFNWSSTGVATGSMPESVQFTLPTADTPGPYFVSVIANGIASAPVLDVLVGSGNYNLALRLDANDPTSIDLLNGGALQGKFSMSAFSSLIITGSNTANTVTLNTPLSGVPVTVNGGITDTLVLNDSSFTSPRTYTVTANTVAWGGASVMYAGVGSLTLQGGTGGNTFTVLGTSAATLLSLVGGSSSDTLADSNAGNSFALLGDNTGTLLGSAYGSAVQFSQIGNLTAGSGGDSFQFAPGTSLSGNIVGSGNSTLDYSAYYTTNVIVDLQTGFATGVGGSVSGIATELGDIGDAQYYNLLIGNGGDTLIGGLGRRNILVAGPSASILEGADGQDLLIGGSTAYDTEAGLTTWERIAHFWATSRGDYATRVADLLSGTAVPLLDASVVMGNGGGNTFIGYGALALLYTDGMDNIGLFDPNSQQVPITP